MSNETPGRDPVPGWGQPKPAPDAEEATAPWPTEAAPPETPWPVEAEPPTAPWPTAAEPPAEPPAAEPPAAEPPAAEPAPAEPWGAPEPVAPEAAPAAPAPAPAPVAPWASTPEPAPAPPAAQPDPALTWSAAPPEHSAPAPGGWSTPPQPAPGWGAPAQQQPPAPAPGGWSPPPQQAASWGAPAQQQPPGGWGTPPQQAPGWGPTGPGAPGGPPVGWAPAPAKSGSNGCLKACLIVGAIGVVLVILGFIVLAFVGSQIASSMVNPDGTLKSCTLISDQALSEALDVEAQALPLDGLWDATMGSFLDKRVLKDAEDCWIAIGSGVTTSATADAATGRLAASSGGDASGAFRQEKEKANQDGYFAGDVSGLGDEAFCTDLSPMGSAGVLVRSGDRLAYVSLVTADPSGGSDTCAAAQQVAKRMLR